MFSDEVVKVDDLKKIYQIYDCPHDRLKQFIYPQLRRLFSLHQKKYFREFSALNGLTFSVKRGETLGIIGKNGSGKSTLLQIICGTLSQTTGSALTFGRVAALLELGSGFNPDFTGRENIYTYSMILGLTKKDVDKKYDDIVSFADIGEFVEEPIKIYSSGMVARLAFSVAVQINPDLLVVDEALSVGDAAFQEKSFTKMKEIRDSGTSILFVSHSLPAVRNFCDKALWMEDGKIRAYGERLEVCDLYQAEMDKKIKLQFNHKNIVNLNADENLKSATKSISIASTSINKQVYKMGEDIKIQININFFKNNLNYGVGLIIYNDDGRIASLLNTLRDDLYFDEPREIITLKIKNNHFSPGKYYVTAVISDDDAMFPYDRSDYCLSFEVEGERSGKGLPKVEGLLRCDHEWV